MRYSSDRGCGARLARRRIAWVGHGRRVPAEYRDLPVYEAHGSLVIPGLVDCHTHLAFAGWRTDEFERRIEGVSYLDIARSGGGILRTVGATRDASTDDLVAVCRKRLSEIAALGVTTIECKSGYGLTVEHELRLLHVYRILGQAQPVRIVPTVLGAHAVPHEYEGRRDGYVALLCDTLLPEVARRDLATFCDVFVERTAFSIDEAERILAAARALGLGCKVHADQLTDSGGAAFAARRHAVSADHLECVSAEGVRALANAGVVAVTLPLASLCLHQVPADARALIDAGVPVAVATDFNPGSAPSYHLPFAMFLACTMQRMTPSEVLKGATIYAARALAIDRLAGSLEPGKAADFAVLDAADVNQWLYHVRPNACLQTWMAGRRIH